MRKGSHELFLSAAQHKSGLQYGDGQELKDPWGSSAKCDCTWTASNVGTQEWTPSPKTGKGFDLAPKLLPEFCEWSRRC